MNGDVSNTKNFDLSENVIHVWKLDSSVLSDSMLERLESFLSDEELIRADRYRIPDDRIRFCAGRAMLRYLSSQYLESRESLFIKINNYGKPYLKGLSDRLSFNISHSGKWIIIAFSSNCHIGVDIQCKNHNSNCDFMTIAKHFFHKDEILALDATSNEEKKQMFYDVWSCKEAVIKSIGVGLYGKKFSVLPLPKQNQYVDFNYKKLISSKDSSIIIRKLLIDKDYSSAIAVHGNKVISGIKVFDMNISHF